MKRALVFFGIFISIIVFSCSRQQNTSIDDILGWQKIEWGMSKKEIFAMYDFEKTAENGYTLSKMVKIAECPFLVMIGFDTNDIIERITLADEKNYNQNRYDIYKGLKELLVKKYGMYTLKEGYNLTWLKKSGVIEVLYDDTYDTSIAIFYKQKSMALDKYQEYNKKVQEKLNEYKNI